MANAFQRAADWLRDKAFGAPPAEAQHAGPPLPAPVDYSAEARDQLFARLDQFAEQRREERRNAESATQENQWGDWADTRADRAEAAATARAEAELLRGANEERYVKNEREADTLRSRHNDKIERDADLGQEIVAVRAEMEQRQYTKPSYRKDAARAAMAQRDRETNQVKEKPVTETVSEAKHDLRRAKEAQQERALQFWQNAVDQGRIMRQETEQVQQKEQAPTPEPAQNP